MRYNFHNMTCTDPDFLQFGQEQSEGCWYYVQVRDHDILERFGGHTVEFIEAYEQDAEFAKLLDSHTRMYGNSWKQICCECIFDQLMLTDYRLDF